MQLSSDLLQFLDSRIFSGKPIIEGQRQDGAVSGFWKMGLSCLFFFFLSEKLEQLCLCLGLDVV